MEVNSARPLPAMSLAIVGAGFSNKKGPSRVFELALCAPGEPVELRPEPKNKADPLAVAVYSIRGVQLGYVTAERCGRIGALIRAGREVQAVFQERTRFGGIVRLAFDGEAPNLPAAGRLPPQEIPDFWPDEEWPDE